MSKRYRLNSRNLLVLSAAPKKEPSRYKLVHVSDKGTIATDGNRIMRVTLPKDERGKAQETSAEPGVIPSKRAQLLAKVLKRPAEFTEPELEPGADAPDYYKGLRNFDRAPVAEIVINAAMLGDLLRAAERFSDNEHKPVRLRVLEYGQAGALRIDAMPTEQGQELTAALMGIRADASIFPGAEPGETGAAPEQTALSLPETKGRKYREE